MVKRQVHSPLDEKFEELVHSTLEKWHVPGISIAVVDGENTWSAGYGIAKFPSTLVTPSTLFYAGSTTKAFTSAMMGMLVEDNDAYPQVQWDTPVSKLIRDDFVLSDEYATKHITIEDILSHRTGLPGHDASYGDKLSREEAVREVVRTIRYLPLTAQPRTKFQYCNLMYIAASHVIETLTGEWLGDSLARRIWGPLDMNSTFFSLEDAKHAKETLSHGYSYDEDSDSYHEIEWLGLNEVSGAGSVITNVLDYAKWTRSLMTGKNSPLSNQVRRAIWEPRTLLPVKYAPEGEVLPFTGPTSYALGWWIGVYQGYRFIEHTGGTNSFTAELILIPDLQYSLVLLGNTESIIASKRLAFHLIDEKLGIPAEKRFDWERYYTNYEKKEAENLNNAVQRFYPSLPSPTLPITLPLSAYAGTYSHPGYQTVTLYLDEGNGAARLRADRTATTWVQFLSFEHVSGEHFLMTATVYGIPQRTAYPAEFRIGADGRPAELGIGWEVEMKGKKIWFRRVD